VIYLDNAATSHPKPPEVLEAMADYLERAGSPGRSGHRLSQVADDLIWDARATVADFFGAGEPDRIVFTLNATMALNLALKGLVRPGDHVVTSSFEHNSVARPMHALEQTGVRWTPIRPTTDSPIDLDRLESELRRGAALIVLSHASNVTGATAPLGPIRQLATRYEVPLLLDAAQTAGHVPIAAQDADVLVFAGHKGLFGPQGTGGMYVSDRVRIKPLLQGGTGGRSESLDQPRWLPQLLETGTPNGVGIAGLAAGVRCVVRHGVDVVAEHEARLRARLVRAVRAVPGVTVHDWPSPEPPVGVVSITIAGMATVDAAALLDERYDISVRAGIHCSALAHRSLGTLEAGTVRFGLSRLTTQPEIDAAASAVAEIAELAVRRRAPVAVAAVGGETELPPYAG
jgi:cysteine desulfurase/selenocysteine lyase